MAGGAECKVARYPRPDELRQQTFAEVKAWRDRFAAVPFEDKGGTWQGRYYQDIAITRVLDVASVGSRWPRCRRSSRLNTATCSTFWPLSPSPLSR